MEKFRYIDDVDRAYGAAGMAISLVIYDGDSLLYSINLDADDPHDIMEMSPDFFFAGNPVVSAKAAWTQIVNNFSIGVSMLIANLMCDGFTPFEKLKCLGNMTLDFLFEHYAISKISVLTDMQSPKENDNTYRTYASASPCGFTTQRFSMGI